MVKNSHKLKTLIRNGFEHRDSAHRNFEAKAFNVCRENAHMSIELTMKAMLISFNSAYLTTQADKLKTHKLSEIMGLDDGRLKNLVLKEIKENRMERKLQDIMTQLMSASSKPWWEPEQRYFGTCDKKTASDLVEKANIIIDWSKDLLI